MSIIIDSSDDLRYNAGEPISFPLNLRDDHDNVITVSFPDPNRFTVFAEGEIDVNGAMREIVLLQQVIANEDNRFFRQRFDHFRL